MAILALTSARTFTHLYSLNRRTVSMPRLTRKKIVNKDIENEKIARRDEATERLRRKLCGLPPARPSSRT